MHDWRIPFLAISSWVVLGCGVARSQASCAYADSVRLAYHIPELAYAVVTAGGVIDMQTLGNQRQQPGYPAKPTDRFHLGSNTKAITALLAAELVEAGKISWDTPFFALFPELQSASRRGYRAIALRQLLTFRAGLPAYTYTFASPSPDELTGDEAAQRLALARYFLAQPPMRRQAHGLTPSNADYVLAGLMLEKATGRSYQDLVTAWGQAHGIAFGFGYPNLTDPAQPWGHNPAGEPLPPVPNPKLSWLLSAGNINVSLPDYVKFVQLQLRGLRGEEAGLPAATVHELLFGLPVFAYGWFNRLEADTQHHVAYNEGNAGAFITRVQVIQEADRAYILFANSATPETAAGLTMLQAYLQRRYGR
ncbi:serine hydrolase domain-containing protein [Hymenobacter ruricola]|uniref:Serine hydrolase n=1 Tax=Hymenobacter ruricola TaxID=2791023 RepID=A0ABS0I321_9BACT|nr:serine hydrolase domain-containing protein [Hymenobacter ruricola]MBF9221340.1 serine hydrolase [Hymenobacter ruricola]